MKANGVGLVSMLSMSVVALMPHAAFAEDDCAYRTVLAEVSTEISPQDSCLTVSISEVGCMGGAEVAMENTCGSEVRIERVQLTGIEDIAFEETLPADGFGLDELEPSREQVGEAIAVTALYRAEVDGETHDIAVSFTASAEARDNAYEGGCSVRGASSPLRGLGVCWIAVLGLVSVGLRVRKRV